MKILHIFFSFKVGGAETMLIDIINKQVHKNEVSLMIINNNIDDQLLTNLDARVKIFKLNRKEKSKNPIPIIRLNWLINTLPLDIIHCHVLSISKYIYYSRIPLYATKHSLGSYGSHCKKYKKIFAISESVLDEISSFGNKNGILAINGINTNLIIQKKNRINDAETYNIITIGRLEHARKGQHILINAIKILIEKYKIENIYLSIIGEGDSFNYLKQLTEENKLQNNIEFLGVRDRKYIYSNLHTYDIFVLPSLDEGLGLSVIEACAAKVPVLISDIEGPMEIIEKGQWGFYFEAGKADSLAQQIHYMINNKSEVRIKSDGAFNKVRKEYTIDNTTRIYNSTYKI